MKNKIFFVIDKNSRIEKVFLTNIDAKGWVARYRNDLPMEAATWYYYRYTVVPYILDQKQLSNE